MSESPASPLNLSRFLPPLLVSLDPEAPLTPPCREQVGELSGQKDSIQSDRELKGKISSLIQELRRHVGQHISSSQSITDGLRRILTPHQVVRAARLPPPPPSAAPHNHFPTCARRPSFWCG